ncbi:CapA family protein [Treponema bryantii]|uniref:CapA family protein n=1 Tax=Treponema bryantii TaxID=163 RepID=UPI0003B366ED|nr:CapA family protein [Treponema bryantii]
MNLKFHLSSFLSFLFISILFYSCGTTSQIINEPAEKAPLEEVPQENSNTPKHDKDTITLLFAGDIMAHSVNYYITTYEKIWRDVRDVISSADLAFANIEAPIDTTKAAASYPSFNMTQKYVQAAVDAGFDVFSLSNNHTNDQYKNGILETIKTSKAITTHTKEQLGNDIYFSGTKETADSRLSALTYNYFESNGWKILFLPITELLNRPDASEYINFIKPTDESRKAFIKYTQELRTSHPCDLFIISVHTSEPEYTRHISERQNQYYMDLLEAGADVVWANHAHIIKDRKLVIDTKRGRDKLIMYANGNTISGQRTKPELTSKNPTGERDNTGDGLFYIVTMHREKDGSMKIKKCEPYFITTYINTANEYVIKPLNQDFVEYLYDVPRTNWAKYIERRIKINKEATKDYIEWQ